MTDEETLVKALKRMGVTAEIKPQKISQYGESETADVVVDSGVGFKREKDGTFSMIGDFYHSKSMKRFYNKHKEFQKELTAAYGVEDALEKVSELNMGFELTGNEECEVGEDGLIRLEFTTFQSL